MSIFNLLSFKEDVHVKNIMNTVSSQTEVFCIYFIRLTRKNSEIYIGIFIFHCSLSLILFFLGGGGYIKFKIENTCTYLTEVFVIRIHIKFMMVRGGGG